MSQDVKTAEAQPDTVQPTKSVETNAVSNDKGKATQNEAEDVDVDEDSGSEEEEGDDTNLETEEMDQDDDDMAEIDAGNIVNSGRRTRGAVIDFAKAAENLGPEEEEEEEEEDADFEPDASKMEE